MVHRTRSRQPSPKSLAEMKKVKWKPQWGENRLHEMVAERPDWCISRQRFWGVPLIVFYCEVAANGSRISRLCATCFRFLNAKVRTRGSRIRQRSCFRPARSALAAEREMAQGIGYSRRLVRFGLHESLGAERKGWHLAGRYVPRRSRPIPRLVSKFAVDCGRHSRTRALPRSDDVRMGAG